MYYVTCKSNSESIELAKKVISCLKRKNLDFEADASLGGNKKVSEADAGFILAIGDDNLILETFRNLGKKQIPLLGIASMQSFLAQS
ncbi:MAG: hypothetical protein Q8R04_01815, partial [Nanoarchaeota archaeon]|nr:hypothetical protein [Nanoarchaeota archaeon]